MRGATVNIKWREEALALILMVSMLVYLPLFLNDAANSSATITWFIAGWVLVRASDIWIRSKRRRQPH